MKQLVLASVALCLATSVSTLGLIINPKYAQPNGTTTDSVQIDISQLRNNRGFGIRPGDANFDGSGAAYPAAFLPDSSFNYAGVNYSFPQYQDGGGNDNVLAQGQIINIPPGRYASVHLLSAAEALMESGSIHFAYSDGSKTNSPILVPPFWAWPYPFGGDMIFPYYLTKESIDYNRSMVFQTTHWIDSTKNLSTLQLPNFIKNYPGSRLHIFALSLVPAAGKGPQLDVLYARSTQTWFEGTNKVQIFEAVVKNTGTDWIMSDDNINFTVQADGLETVQPGSLYRLRPGDQARIQIGVRNNKHVKEGSKGRASLIITGKHISTTYSFAATFGIAPYDSTYESIYDHESPPWFNDAKFGIFIHWGVYSVPGWGNVGQREGYAEWYWWYLNQGPRTTTQTYQYHLDTYGEGVVYDDFISNFTADAFDPKTWVDLFVDAGAKYFVQVSKHHDGYALFDMPANVTRRTSVAQFPHRNLLKELFDAAEKYQPSLHRATYFSLPEWFHPDYAPIGFSSWPGGNATSPYTNTTLPYKGYVHVSNFVEDIIVPEMQQLARMGTEMMWCDIGGPNMTVEFASSYFNAMAAEGKQVSINNRCGTPGDFDTPEYARYQSVQARKWESSLGMDPYSYGYNRATPDDAYMKPGDIVTSLMDIISKNGNFLLDVGPTANGTIIEVEQRNLRDAGRWIRSHAEAIYNTTYWYIAPQDGEAVRFTQTLDAFYITCIHKPNSTLTLREPVPWVIGDKITVVGGKMAGSVVPAKQLHSGHLELCISQEVIDSDQYAWVFKINYHGDI